MTLKNSVKLKKVRNHAFNRTEVLMRGRTQLSKTGWTRLVLKMKQDFKELEILIGHSIFHIIQKMVLLVVACVPWYPDFELTSIY